MRPGACAWLGLSCVLALACESGSTPSNCIKEKSDLTVQFETKDIQIVTRSDTIPLTVEVADTEARRSYGLMDRCELSQNSGMLFLYSEPQDSASGFWMFRTRIPLDIAFVDQSGQIISILSMDPCQSPDPQWCSVYSPHAPYAGALEMNGGYFMSRGIAVGDNLILDRKE
jgi:uncharacterized protein